MAESILSAPYFHNESEAYKFVEARVWPRGPVCPHCGGVERISLMGGDSTRIGTYKCYDCRKPFTVKVGTIFESSHVPLRLWLQAIFLIAASKKGVSANQLHRTLGVTLKTAWFMGHRIREAMREGNLVPFGRGGGGVEVDETYIGRDPKRSKPRMGPAEKNRVLSLVDRATGRSHSMVIDSFKARDVVPILRTNIAREARVLTDGAGHYKPLALAFARHDSVDHKAGEYVSRTDPSIHTNTIEGFFSIFKRGMRGVYQHCGKEHLHRYLAEFDFRYSNRVALGVSDPERAVRLLLGVKGKRLTYRTISH
jgi:transposase-like protein